MAMYSRDKITPWTSMEDRWECQPRSWTPYLAGLKMYGPNLSRPCAYCWTAKAILTGTHCFVAVEEREPQLHFDRRKTLWGWGVFRGLG
jgi:hypothetical protein